MKYYDYEDNLSNKIPYDKEPIFRQTSYKKPKSAGAGKSRGVLSFLVCILIIINLIFGGVILNSISGKNNGEANNITINLSADSGLDVSAVASKAKLSVVCVHAGITAGSTQNPDYQGFFNLASKGSGVIFRDSKTNGEAYIVTCFHVIRGYTTQVFVLLYDSYIPIKATMVYYSSVYDIAVLKISGEEYVNSNATPAQIADSSFIVEGDEVVAIGNPLGSGFSVTNGVISKTTDLVLVDGITHRVMRTDAPINNGNSGGGLFDNNGSLIGIVSAKATDNTANNNYIDCVAYAIPSNIAISLAGNIIRNEMPEKAVLGITMGVDPSGVKFDIINGKVISVQSVVVNLADEGSQFKMYDKITAFSYGETVVKVINLYSFEDHVFNLGEGDKVKFFIERDGREMTIEITINNVVSADYEDWYGK